MLYYGFVIRVLPPESANNINRSQYEYMVLATMDNFAKVSINNAILADEFGAADDYNDRVLKFGQKVIVWVPYGDFKSAVIVSCVRNTQTVTAESLGYHWRRRFNQITQMIDNSMNYSLVSDAGPNLHVKTDSIILDDASGDSITIDKANKIIKINCKDFKAEITGNATLNVGGSVTVKAASANVTVSGACDVKAGKLNAKVDGEANIDAGGKVVVKGSKIELNGSMGNVMTTGPAGTQPMCYITGIPFVGSTKVKAGS